MIMVVGGVDVRDLRGREWSDRRRELFGIYSRPRNQSTQAREALSLYAPHSQALQGRMASMEAYAILMIAELFCSGSRSRPCRLLYRGPPSAGFTRTKMFCARRGVVRHGAHAECRQQQLVYLAQVGKARALLGAANSRKRHTPFRRADELHASYHV